MVLEVFRVLGFEFAGILVALICLFHSTTNYHIRSRRHSLYLLFVVTILGSLLCSSISNALNILFPGGDFFRIVYFFQEGYFLVHIALMVAYVGYLMECSGALIGRNKSFYYIYLTPFFFSAFLVFINPVTGIIFYYHNLTYCRGPLMPVMYLIGVFYVALGLYFFIYRRNTARRIKNSAFGTYMAFTILGILVQGIWGDLLVEVFCESLTALGFMITIENESTEIDRTTKLYNRDAFLRRVKRLNDANVEYRMIHLRLMNISMYTRILPVEKSDQLHREVTQFLKDYLETADVYRYDTTSYVCIFQDEVFTNGKHPACEMVTQALAERFELPWNVMDVTANLQARVQVLNIPKDASTLDDIRDILESDDNEAYHTVTVISGERLEKVRRRPQIEKAIRKALENNTLEVYYQPIWSSVYNRTIAAEALVRLVDDELGFIPPSEFIPIAEQNGMIVEVGSYVYEHVCRFIHDAQLRQRGIKYIEVNLSLYQFMYKDLITSFDAIREHYSVPVEMLNLEITESAEAEGISQLLEDAISKLRALGYHFSLDDYGTGFANLNRLLTGNYTNVKIDASILWDSDSNQEKATLLDNLINTIKNLKLNVIQEGVETRQQLERVLASGCTMIQGFYFSKPLPEKSFLQYIYDEGHML